MLSSILEALGLVLLVLAALVAFGPAAALATGGACCLVTSYAVTRPAVRRRPK